MFGLFRKKPKVAAVAPSVIALPQQAQPIVQTGPAQSVLVWHAEIGNVRNEFSSQLQIAISNTTPVLATMGSNVAVLDTVWGPMGRQLEIAKQEMTHAWNRARSALARDNSVSDEQEEEADRRYDIEIGELEFDFEEGYRASKAQAANALMQTALHTDARDRACAGCSQPLTSFLIGQTQNITCNACGVAQSVDPGTAFRIFASSAALWVGEWDGFSAWRTMMRAQIRIEHYREAADVPLPLLHEFHDSAAQYWQTVFGVEAQLVPQGAPHVPRKVAARMKDAYRLLRQHWQWREVEAQRAQ